MRKYIFMLFMLLAVGAVAQGGIKGAVVDKRSQAPLVGVSIYLPDFKMGTTTDSTGRFHLANTPASKVLLQSSFVGYRTSVVEVFRNSEVLIKMEPAATEINEVVVTGMSKASEQKRVASPVAVVSQKMLTQISSTNIIDALSVQPGISQITTGAGISKPVIRGLGYNRVLVVNDGIRQEGQQWGDEHGVEVDQFGVDRVEILKGPASLAYGSDAMAGVINLISAPLPADKKMGGSVTSEYQTNNGLIGTSANVAGNTGPFVWDFRASGRLAHDYKNRYDGYVFNSGFREHSFSTTLGIKRDWGYSNLILSYYNLKPGIVEGDRDDLTGKFIKKVDVNGAEESRIVSSSDSKSYNPSVPFQKVGHYKAVLSSFVRLGDGHLKSIIGFQQNRRKEFANVLEPSTPELYFKLSTVNYDFQYQLPQVGGFDIAAGVNGMFQRSQNLAEEVLVPEYHLFDYGIFTIVKRNFGRLDVTGGIRFDNRRIDSKALFVGANEETSEHPFAGATERFSAFTSTFNGTSGSVGATYQLSKVAYIKANLSRGYRAPNIAELGSNGVHEGTLRYEAGNAALKAEHSLQADLGVGLSTEHISAELNLFSNRVSNFIYLHKLQNRLGQDSTIDGASVFKFTSGDARLLGGEVRFDIHPHPFDWIHLENSFSYVLARLKDQPDTSKYLPFTPAPRLLSSIRFEARKVARGLGNGFFRFDVESTFAQNNVYTAFNTETRTPSYVLLNAVLGVDLIRKGITRASLQVGVNNLTDRAYQSHLSRLKYAPENLATGRSGVYNMGRNVTFRVAVPF